ncbi:MAG: response regulator [Bacteroidales bacterium]|nr:response regulator [Bacteroidales bacterium]
MRWEYHYKYILLLVMALLLHSARLYADMDFFRHLTIDDGLSQNTVFCIKQDKLGFMWFGTKDGLCRYDGKSFKIYNNDPEVPNSIGSNYIHAIHEDRNEDLWIGTDVGLYIYDRRKDIFRRFDKKTKEGKSIDRLVQCIVPDTQGNILIGVYWVGMFKYDPDTDELTSISYTDGSTTGLSSNGIWNIHADSNNIAWIATVGGGLNRYDMRTGDIQYFYTPDRLSNDITSVIEIDSRTLLLGTTTSGVWRMDKQTFEMSPYMNDTEDGMYVRCIQVFGDKVYVGTENGLHCYSRKTGRKRTYTLDYSNRHSLSCNAVYSLCEDRDGGLWIGTYFGGVNYLSPNTQYFSRFYATGQQNSLSGNVVREIVEDRSGNLWIGTEDNGLNYYDSATGEFRNYNPENSSLTYHNIHGLYLDDDTLYVGYFHHGMDVIDLKDFSVTNYKGGHGTAGTISDNNVFSICKTRTGAIYVGTIYGLNLFNPKDGTFTIVPELFNVNVNDIMEDSRGMVWVASNDRGLYCHVSSTGEWTNHPISDKESGSANVRTTSLNEDNKGNIWISTEGGGAIVHDPFKDTFVTYTTNDGLPSNVVHKVLNGKNGRMWISTNKGLTEFDPESGSFYSHTHYNGLLSNQFNYKSGIETSDGKLYFGSIGGLIGLDPEASLKTQQIPSVVITRFDLFNREIRPTDESGIIDSSIVLNPEITLTHKQSCFSFEFAALSYDMPELNQYAYRLKGLEEDWVYIDGNQRVNYLNVPHGKYEFQVRGRNSNGVWNENGASVKIRIKPPFHASAVGVILEILICLFFAGIIVYLWKRKEHNKHILLVNKIKEEEEIAMHKARLAFFVNMTHEIKTPLSLITAPFEQLESMHIENDDIAENMVIIGSNIRRLVNLTNEILDFSKLEKSGFEVHMHTTDVNELFLQCLRSYKRIIEDRSLSLSVGFPEKHLVTALDPEIMIKMLTNLLNNAVKFARQSISITLTDDTPEEGWLSVVVSNDGRAIDNDNIEKIFDPFFQEKNEGYESGFGIGLSLVRQLAELHGGRIYLNRNNDDGVSFCIEIPKTDITVGEESISDIKNYDSEDSEKKTIVIADDESQMLSFICSSLRKHYNIIACSNGEEVLDVLKNKEVNLIVADLRMPKMDGIELCRSIKSDFNFSHIPVIILTAQDDTATIVKAMEAGVDNFLSKPFSMNQLEATVKNLLSKTLQMQKTFSKDPGTPTDEVLMDYVDENFINKITDVILNHKDDSDNSIDHLAAAMNISRSSLYRKIKSMSSLSPNEFIRLCRLRHAAKLLDEGEYRISEICYLVGFNSPSYFTKCFQQQFNMTPKEYKKRKR